MALDRPVTRPDNHLPVALAVRLLAAGLEVEALLAPGPVPANPFAPGTWTSARSPLLGARTIGAIGSPGRSLTTGPNVAAYTIRRMRAHPTGDDVSPVDEHLGPTQYVIWVRGVLSDRLLTAFPGLWSCTERGDTLLAGALPTRRRCMGSSHGVEALGLELLEVRRSRR